MAVCIVIPIMILLFLLQLALCFRVRALWIRLLPCILLLFGVMFCAAAYVVCCYLESAGADIYGAVFGAVLYGVFLGIALAAAAGAWLLYFLVKFIQKSKK